MLEIKQFIIDKSAQLLTVELASYDRQLSDNWTFNFEFLRVITLESTPKTKLATHKKQVQLTRIEAVDKHGYRFCFDDDFCVIYSLDELTLLNGQAEQLWQNYLAELKKSGHTREATINIQQL